MRIATFTCALLTLIMVGCATDMHWVSDPERNRVIRVDCGDRWFFTLDESHADDRAGCRWTATSDDKDAEVLVDHHDGKAKVRIRIFRGFDGPATITFRLRRPGMTEDVKSFTVCCYRRTGDWAFWAK